MKTVLLNHVVSGAVRAEDLTDGMMAENLAGNMMTIRYYVFGFGFHTLLFFRGRCNLLFIYEPCSRLKPAVTVGGARVAKTDLELLNLVVHTLDDVIDPASLPDGDSGDEKKMKGKKHHYGTSS